MPNPIIQNYLNDKSVDENKRRALFQDLEAGKVNEDDIAGRISQKYGAKYQPNSPQTQAGNPVTGAFDWLHKNTQGFRDWIDNTAEKTGANAGAREITKAYDKAKATPVVGQALSFTEGMSNAGRFAVPTFAQSIGNQTKAIGDIVGFKPLSDVGSTIKGVGDYTKNQAAQAGPANSFSAGVGDVLGSVAGQVPGMVAGSGAVNLGSKAATAAGVGANIVKPAAFVANSVLGTENAVSAGQGRFANPTEIGTGLAFDSALYGLGSLAKKYGPGAANWLYRFGTKLEGTSPEKNIELVDRALEQGLTGSRSQLIDKSREAISSQGQRLEQVANSARNKFGINDVLNDAVEEATDLAKSRNVRTSKTMTKIIDEIRDGGKDKLDVPELLDLKRTAADKLKRELASGTLDSVQSAEKRVWASIYRKAGELLDSVSPEVKELNRNMEAAYNVLEPSERLAVKPGSDLDIKKIFNAIVRSPLFTTKAAEGLNKFSGPVGNALTSKIAPLLPKTLFLGRPQQSNY